VTAAETFIQWGNVLWVLLVGAGLVTGLVLLSLFLQGFGNRSTKRYWAERDEVSDPDPEPWRRPSSSSGHA
jgi:hypothetical protein